MVAANRLVRYNFYQHMATYYCLRLKFIFTINIP